MKTILLTLLCSLPFIGFTQIRGSLSDQNPNHEQAYAEYAAVADSIEQQQSVTLQNTYQPIDKWQEKKDWREYKKKERFEARMHRLKYGTPNRYYRPYRNYRHYSTQYRYRYHNRGFNWSPYFLIP